MADLQELLDSYVHAVEYPAPGGEEVLRMLRARSALARREADLTPVQQEQLADADDTLLRHAPRFYDSVTQVGRLPALREKERVSHLHWWWFLEKLIR